MIRQNIQQKAMKESNVLKHLEGKEVVKVIVIKGRIVNIVVKQKVTVYAVTFYFMFKVY